VNFLPNHKRVLQWLALSGVLLRILVPAGFMPADVGDGWYLKLCPDGMPASTMVALFGHHHHHHADGHADGQEEHFAADMLQCDLGGGLSADTVAYGVQLSVAVAATGIDETQPVAPATVRALPSAYHPRAPPVLLV